MRVLILSGGRSEDDACRTAQQADQSRDGLYRQSFYQAMHSQPTRTHESAPRKRRQIVLMASEQEPGRTRVSLTAEHLLPLQPHPQQQAFPTSPVSLIEQHRSSWWSRSSQISIYQELFITSGATRTAIRL
jgi:hypothetical protein